MATALTPATIASQLHSRFLSEQDATRLFYLLPQQQEKAFSIQFLSPDPGAGTSSITRDFAVVASNRLGLNILLISISEAIGKAAPVIHNRYALPVQAATEMDLSFEGNLAAFKVQQIPLSIVIPHEHVGSRLHQRDWINFITGQENSFDLILIDSPAASASHMGAGLSANVDANIIVLEAEKTDYNKTKYLINCIEEVKGYILGTILNKRHFYIPSSIYKKI